jgi:hypothetical protein
MLLRVKVTQHHITKQIKEGTLDIRDKKEMNPELAKALDPMDKTSVSAVASNDGVMRQTDQERIKELESWIID